MNQELHNSLIRVINQALEWEGLDTTMRHAVLDVLSKARGVHEGRGASTHVAHLMGSYERMLETYQKWNEEVG